MTSMYILTASSSIFVRISFCRNFDDDELECLAAVVDCSLELVLVVVVKPPLLVQLVASIFLFYFFVNSICFRSHFLQSCRRL
jgi:hypothetical protein